MFGLHIGCRLEGGERVRRKWRKCQGVVSSALGRHREEWHQLHHRKKEGHWAWSSFPSGYSFVPVQPLLAVHSHSLIFLSQQILCTFLSLSSCVFVHTLPSPGNALLLSFYQIKTQRSSESSWWPLLFHKAFQLLSLFFESRCYYSRVASSRTWDLS